MFTSSNNYDFVCYYWTLHNVVEENLVKSEISETIFLFSDLSKKLQKTLLQDQLLQPTLFVWHRKQLKMHQKPLLRSTRPVILPQDPYYNPLMFHPIMYKRHLFKDLWIDSLPPCRFKCNILCMALQTNYTHPQCDRIWTLHLGSLRWCPRWSLTRHFK